jgi:hypothetical protein
MSLDQRWQQNRFPGLLRRFAARHDGVVQGSLERIDTANIIRLPTAYSPIRHPALAIRFPLNRDPMQIIGI